MGDSVFATQDQEHFQESLDQLHSPTAPPTLTLGDPQHQRGGAPHPLASRPRWDEPEYAWSGEDLQRVGGGQREPQRRVGLNLEPVLAPKKLHCCWSRGESPAACATWPLPQQNVRVCHICGDKPRRADLIEESVTNLGLVKENLSWVLLQVFDI